MPMIVDERLSLPNERVVRGDSMASFTPADRQSVDLMFFTISHVWQTWSREVRLGLLRQEDVLFPDPANRFWNSEAHRELWPKMRPTFSEDFAKFWEERFDLTRGG